MKNNKVFLSVVAVLGLSVSIGAQAAVVSITTGSNPYYQYQQENAGTNTVSSQPQTLPQSATNIQAQQRMQAMQQQNTQQNSGNNAVDPNAQSYADAAKIGQQQTTSGQSQQSQQNTGPKTAYEQGFGSEQDALAQQEALEEWANMQSARQQGETIPVPKPLNVVANDKTAKVFLINWKGVLVEQVGMKPEKVDFEAARLTKDEFSAWASRQVRYIDPNTIAVNP